MKSKKQLMIERLKKASSNDSMVALISKGLIQKLEKKPQKKQVHPTREQEAILYGTLLGDSHLYSKGCVQIEQQLKHKEYVEWLFNKLKSLTTGNPPKEVTRIDKRNNTETKSVRFYTRCLFKHLKNVFYNEKGVKILPKDFSHNLCATALAIWFLDDGSKCSNMSQCVFLTVDNFTSDEILEIQEKLRTQFDIDTRLAQAGVSKKGLIQQRLVITSDNYQKFRALVYPIIKEIPSMVLKKLP